MPQLALSYTPVRARRGRLIHVVSLAEPETTACGRRPRGWVVVPRLVSCRECKLALHHDARSPRRR